MIFENGIGSLVYIDPGEVSYAEANQIERARDVLVYFKGSRSSVCIRLKDESEANEVVRLINEANKEDGVSTFKVGLKGYLWKELALVSEKFSSSTDDNERSTLNGARQVLEQLLGNLGEDV